jgi:hypothetical protein
VKIKEKLEEDTMENKKVKIEPAAAELATSLLPTTIQQRHETEDDSPYLDGNYDAADVHVDADAIMHDPNQPSCPPNGEPGTRRSRPPVDQLYDDIAYYDDALLGQQNPNRKAGVTEVEFMSTITPNVQMVNVDLPKFNDDGTMTWESFERTLTYRLAGRPPRQKIEMLQMALGQDALEWYNLEEGIWNLPYEDQLEKLRDNFSLRQSGEEGMGVPHDVVMKAGEPIGKYRIRAAHACLHLKPAAFRAITGEDKRKEAARKIQHYGDERCYEKILKDVFIAGLPSMYRTKIFDKPELMSQSLQVIVKQCKTWEKGVKVVQRGDASNLQKQNIAFHNAAAVAYHTQKQESGDDSSADEEEPTFVGVARALSNESKPQKHEEITSKNREKSVKFAVETQLVKEKQKAQQMQLQALVAKIEELETKVANEKLAEQVEKTLGDMLPDRMRDMMIKDTKPTAKAGTKGDPTAEQLEEIRRNKAERNFQGRAGYNRGGYHRGNGKGRAGFNNRGRGFNRGGYNRGGYGRGTHNHQNYHQQYDEYPSGQSNKSNGNSGSGDPMKYLDTLARAVEKSTAVMEQHTTAIAQLFNGPKN